MDRANNDPEQLLKRTRRRGSKARTSIKETKVYSQKDSKQAENVPEKKNVPDKKNVSELSSNKSGKHGDIANSKSTKKKKRITKWKPGVEGYKTKTQLRNELKRKAKKRKREEHLDTHDIEDDPSSMYIDDPECAPVVLDAIEHMTKLLEEQKAPTRKFNVTTGPRLGWRTVSKLAVRKPNNGAPIQIGLFKPKSHVIVPIHNCFAHHPAINICIPILQQLCVDCRVEAYDEHTNEGQLRYVAINVERATRALQITLVWNGSNNGKEDSTLNTLVEALIDKAVRNDPSSDNDEDSEDDDGFRLHSLWVHFHHVSKHNNAIFGRDDNSWVLKHGKEVLEESIDKICSCPYKVRLRFPPNVFRQANLDAFAQIIKVIRLYIDEFSHQQKLKPKCLELYGGVGTIGLHLLDLLDTLVSSDENPYNSECFNASSSQVKGDKKNKCFKLASICSYLPHNASHVVTKTKALMEANICIVDPPRKGLDKKVVKSFIDYHPNLRMLVYVSCGFPAFKRDCEDLLKENSSWSLVHSEGFVLFPGADAIETLAIFVKNGETKV